MKHTVAILTFCGLSIAMFALLLFTYPTSPIRAAETTPRPTLSPTELTEMLPSDLDIEAGSMFTSFDNVITMKVPTGWTLPPDKPVEGQAPNRYFINLYSVTDRQLAVNTSQVLLAGMQVELHPVAMLFQFVQADQPKTIHNALQGYMGLYKDYANFGTEITERTIGADKLQGSCTTMIGAGTTSNPSMDGTLCMALVDENTATLISYGAQTRLKSLLAPTLEDMLATLKLVPANILTTTPVLPTPTFTPTP